MTSEQRRQLKLAISEARAARAAELEADLGVGDERDCPVCHREFVMAHRTQKYCSHTCRKTAWRRTPAGRTFYKDQKRRRYLAGKVAA